MRFWLQCAAGFWLLSVVQAGQAPRAVLCPAASLPAFQCGDLRIPRPPSTRFILLRTNLRRNDGLEQYLTGLQWPLDFGNALVPAQQRNYLIASWREAGEDRAAVYPVEAGTQAALAARFAASGYPWLDVNQAGRDFRRRINAAPPSTHARIYPGPFRLAGFRLGGGGYEFTLLENPDGVDLLCVEAQALIAPRHWWLVPVHIIPTDDKWSHGVITWNEDSAQGKERKVEEVRFPLRKARVLEE